jgi:hypothetical protein
MAMSESWSTFTRAVVVAVVLLLTMAFVYAIRPMIGPLIIAALLPIR